MKNLLTEGGVFMKASVTNLEKKEFIRWFLKRYDMKRRECVWVLNYIIGHDDLLERIHFVEEAHFCPRAMVMSTTDSSGIPFRFYKGNIMTADAEKSFHDLRLNADEDMYIQLNFPKIPPNPTYLSVLEENPHIPGYLQSNFGDKEVAEKLLEASMKEFQQDTLLKQIDEAIDRGDKELFLQLTEQLNEINQ